MRRSEMMVEKLRELTASRKRGEISQKEYYKGLMDLLVELSGALEDEKGMTEEEIKKQIPLLRVFLVEQTRNMVERGH